MASQPQDLKWHQLARTLGVTTFVGFIVGVVGVGWWFLNALFAETPNQSAISDQAYACRSKPVEDCELLQTQLVSIYSPADKQRRPWKPGPLREGFLTFSQYGLIVNMTVKGGLITAVEVTRT